MLIDCVLYNGESDLLKLRLDYLSGIVDKFVVLEFDTTFSGEKKPFHLFNEDVSHIKSRSDVDFYCVNFSDLDFNSRVEWDRPMYTNFKKSINRKHRGQRPSDLRQSIQREIVQRDYISDIILKYYSEKDLFLISDVDEIPSRSAIRQAAKTCERVSYFLQVWSNYYADLIVKDTLWIGSYLTDFSNLHSMSPDLLRHGAKFDDSFTDHTMQGGGWHLSYMGGRDEIMRKMKSLAWQGWRTELNKQLSLRFPRYMNWRLERGQDLLGQGRPLEFDPSLEKQDIFQGRRDVYKQLKY